MGAASLGLHLKGRNRVRGSDKETFSWFRFKGSLWGEVIYVTLSAFRIFFFFFYKGTNFNVKRTRPS